MTDFQNIEIGIVSPSTEGESHLTYQIHGDDGDVEHSVAFRPNHLAIRARPITYLAHRDSVGPGMSKD